MTRRPRAIAFAVAAAALALAGCTAATVADAEGGRGLDTLAPFRGSNGLLSNVAGDAFAHETLADTALGLRTDDLLDAERPAPSDELWRRLWTADADDALWKAHVLCGAVPPAQARAVVPEGEQADLLGAARVQFERATGDGSGGLDERSLSALVAVHVARCLGDEDLLDVETSATVRGAADANAALALQWRDVLTPGGHTDTAVPQLVASTHLPAAPPAECDDRTAMEAGALLLLDAAEPTRIRELARCGVDDALDSDDPQVLLTAARVLDHIDLPGEERAHAELERRMAEVRRDGGGYARRVAVAGSLSGTVAGLRLLDARGVELAPAEAARVLSAMSAAARPGTADALLVLQGCLLVHAECGAYAGPGLAAAEVLVRESDPAAAALDGLLSALATVHAADPSRVDAIAGDLAASAVAPCARHQLALFADAAHAGGWPDASTLSAARRELSAAIASARFEGYCDVSWVSRFTGAPPSSTPAPSGVAYTREGFPMLRDEIAPLSIAAAAADLGFHD